MNWEKLKLIYKRINDLELHANWKNYTKSYYVMCTIYLGMINGKPKYKGIYLHHLIKEIKDDEVIDHFDHNTLNNLENNLRVTKKEKK